MRKTVDIDIDKLIEGIDRIGDSEPELVAASRFVLEMKLRERILDRMKISVPFCYHLYVLSKANAARCTTPCLFERNKVVFSLVVEPQDKKEYARRWGHERLILLPENNKGLSYARCYVRDYSAGIGEEKHWQLDDDISGFSMNGEETEWITTAVHPSRAFYLVESSCEKYSNIACAAPSNSSFPPKKKGGEEILFNKLVASCFLVDNRIDCFRWSIDRVEDIDYCMEVLTSGLCTLKFANVFFGKANDLSVSGNYSKLDLYQKAKAEIMAKWPGVFKVNRLGRLRSNIWIRFRQRPKTYEEMSLEEVFRMVENRRKQRKINKGFL